MSVSQPHVSFGVGISTCGRKLDGSGTKTCACCFKIEKKNQQLKSGSYSVSVVNLVWSHIRNGQFYVKVWFGWLPLQLRPSALAFQCLQTVMHWRFILREKRWARFWKRGTQGLDEHVGLGNDRALTAWSCVLANLPHFSEWHKRPVWAVSRYLHGINVSTVILCNIDTYIL